jgi:carboxyl-terminal processing protease
MTPIKRSLIMLKKKLEKVLKALDEYFGFIKDLDRNEFSLYINSITALLILIQIIFAAEEKERFDVN